MWLIADPKPTRLGEELRKYIAYREQQYFRIS